MTQSRVTTCIDPELKRKADIMQLSFSKALTIGLEALLNVNQELESKKKERSDIKARLAILDAEIGRIEAETENSDESRRKELEVIIPHLKLLRESSLAISRDPNYAKGRCRFWNQTTKQNLTVIQFMDLCRRYERGEFSHTPSTPLPASHSGSGDSVDGELTRAPAATGPTSQAAGAHAYEEMEATA